MTALGHMERNGGEHDKEEETHEMRGVLLHEAP